MEEMQDYYAFLGVSRNADIDEIRQVIIRMRRGCQDDIEKYSFLQEIQDILCDAAKKKQYDIDLQYGGQIACIKEKVKNSKTESERQENLERARELYLEVLKLDKDNADALWNLAGIEEALKNTSEAIEYLKILAKLTSGEDKLEILHRLGVLYNKQGRTDEAIPYFYDIYKADAGRAGDVKALVRFYYEKKNKRKIALQILNDCISRCKDRRIKITYLCEMLRAVLFNQKEGPDSKEEEIYRKLEGFCSDDKNENLANAQAMLAAVIDFDTPEIKRREWFHRFEEIYLSYHIDDEKTNHLFEVLQQGMKLDEKKIHEALGLCLENEWTDELRWRLSEMIAYDAAAIKESLEYVKKNAPLYWEFVGDYQAFEKVIDEHLVYSNELKEIKNNLGISAHMKKILELFLINTFVSFEKLKPEFDKAVDGFFENEEKDRVRNSLLVLEEYYPASYKVFSDFFFGGESAQGSSGSAIPAGEGKSAGPAQEDDINKPAAGSLTPSSSKVYFPDAAEGYAYKPYFSGLWEGFLIVIGTCFLPPVILPILLYKYYNRHQKKIFRIARKALIIASIAAFAALAGYSFITAGQEQKSIEQEKLSQERLEQESIEQERRKQEKQEQEYAENHNTVLTEKELASCKKMDESYLKKAGVSIRVLQLESYDSVYYPDDDFIWLLLSGNGYGNKYDTSEELRTNCLDENSKAALTKEIEEIYASDAADFVKCRQFYELAYKYAEDLKNEVTVPNLVGMSVEEAKKELSKHGLSLGKKSYEYSSDHGADVILNQYTNAGEKAIKGDTVYVDVSSGKEGAEEEAFFNHAGNEDAYYDTSVFSGPYKVNADIFYHLEDECASRGDNLKIDELTYLLQVNKNDCEFYGEYYGEEDYYVEGIRYDASLYGVSGYVDCISWIKNYKTQTAWRSVQLTWCPYDQGDIGTVRQGFENDSRFRSSNGRYVSDNGKAYIGSEPSDLTITKVRFTKYAE